MNCFWIKRPAINTLPLLMAFTFIILGLLRLNWALPPISGLGATLNDQVGYIAGARSLVDKGWIDSCCIYPSTLLQETRQSVFYGPGHYWAMALPIWLFGANEISFMLANGLSFLGCVLLLFSCGKKLRDVRTGFLTSLTFSVFPFILTYAISSMAELTVLFSTVLAFWLGLLIKETRFKWVAPLIATIPVFFRETSIVVIFPMAGVLFSKELKQKKYLGLIMFILLSVLCWVLVMMGPLGGRPSLLKANVFGGFSEIYLDAIALKNFNPGIPIWIKTVLYKFTNNLIYAITNASLSFENITQKTLLFLTVLNLVVGAVRRDYFELGVAFMGIVLWSFVCGFYALDGLRGLRVLLVLVPFFSVSIAEWISFLSIKRLSILTTMLFLIGGANFLWLSRGFSQERKIDQDREAFINSLEIDSDRVLIAPYWIGLPWVYRNYPSKWSFFPANYETLSLLDKRVSIGTIILSESEVQRFGKKAIEQLNFDYVKAIKFQSDNLSIFKKRAQPPL